MADQIARRYKAFISYSNLDRAAGKKFFRKLDGYRPPKSLRGRQTELGPVPDKLYPVFRDREELATSSDLSARIDSALKCSDHLVVLCSPHAAASKWVNEEVLRFQRLGKADRIHAVLLDGEPEEAFPPSLKRAGTREPIAADLREAGDGWRDRPLKVIAGILGLGFGELKDREQARRSRRIAWATGLSVAVILALAVAGAFSLLKAQEAARNLADSYVQQGQRAAAIGEYLIAGPSFRRALQMAGSALARAGLIETLSVPITFEAAWSAASEGDRIPGLTSVVFVNDAQIAVGDRSGIIRLIDLSTLVEVWSYNAGQEVKDLSFSVATEEIVAGLSDGTLQWIEVGAGMPLVSQKIPAPILSLRYRLDGDLLLIGLTEGVIVLNERHDRVFELVHDHAGSVQGLAFNVPGDHIY
jgi:hypothetical protein